MEVLLIIILGFWLLGLLGRWSLRWWLARKLGEAASGEGAARAHQRAQKAQERAAAEAKRHEGEVHVKQSAPADDKTVARNVGEYVEFEEVSES